MIARSAPIIRAHDLGEHNLEIISYYAQGRPDCVFHICRESDPIIDRMGTVDEPMARLKRGKSLPTRSIRLRRVAR